MGTIFFYLATYFFVEVTGRLFESTVILALLAGLSLTDWLRNVFLFLVSMQSLFYYVSNIYQSWMGFGSR
ncbi:hypothetical protein DSCW_09660 [Desulfosarcina widdelii]|uniref:Uncharacterized protein n=1 Tax=Desulfosarcina widdelii TaxID=947919 RepID=A0A5K7YZX0_9BACT|nr:hypothetical protein DSCW_09660 [Desulfosarcina widdelii]